MKVAIVADWLNTFGGAERVVKSLSEIFPDAPIYTSQYSEKQVDWFKGCDVRTGWLQKVPHCLRKLLPVLRVIYFSRLDLSEYDLVISSACAEAKGVKTNPDALHVSYFQGPPTQYYWGFYDQYMKNPGFGKLDPVVRFFFRLLVRPLRKIDYKFAQNPDYIIANSNYAAAEIKKYYKRDSVVIWPSFDIGKFKLRTKKSDYFITTARHVGWKRLDLAVEACKKTDNKLILVGDGSEHAALQDLAAGDEDIEFTGFADSGKIADLVARAKGYIQPSLEPFGISPIEALATGTPVIAYGAGGALDYVEDGQNGLFFDQQTTESLVRAIDKFAETKFNPKTVSKSAKKFSDARFKKEIKDFVDEKLAE
ncbi:MAG: glycosyltransferase [Candidatus Nomurabacteria bacterium]|jgi:glycosyltransferase involved in cell wall biosynthesis|nr:glycosyltransferase [Candidatus Nomurabacteria bacterium]